MPLRRRPVEQQPSCPRIPALISIHLPHISFDNLSSFADDLFSDGTILPTQIQALSRYFSALCLPSARAFDFPEGLSSFQPSRSVSTMPICAHLRDLPIWVVGDNLRDYGGDNLEKNPRPGRRYGSRFVDSFKKATHFKTPISLVNYPSAKEISKAGRMGDLARNKQENNGFWQESKSSAVIKPECLILRSLSAIPRLSCLNPSPSLTRGLTGESKEKGKSGFEGFLGYWYCSC